MITEEQIDLLVEKLIKRVQEANTYFLKNIGRKVKKIGMLKPTEAQQLVQILKYGGSYEEIIKTIAKYTGLTIKDIDEIFKAYAKKDQLFYKQFYQYRNIPFVPYEENITLKRQTEALANIVKNEAYNFMRSNVLGYTINGEFKGLRETYNELLDTALLNVGQGKETYEAGVANILKEIGGSGLKTIEYESGRSIRLDSAVRMHLKGRLRELHNENQKLLGEEFGADGVEISVHANPAPDHEESQGRQFSKEEYEKLNAGFEAKDYKGHIYTLDHDGNGSYRPISEMNCFHRIFSIILGVSRPVKTDEELQQIRDENNKGFELDGKHYTNYQGTQLQRSLERKIREQKDIQILAKSADNKELIAESQSNITALTKKYKELAEISGLPTKAERLRVSGYKKVAKSKLK
jgi:hypothetical protein